MRLRLVTWNIHSCVGTDRRYDPGRIASVLKQLDADVIALQEVDWRSPPHEGLDQLAFLARSLGMDAVTGPNLIDHRGEFGNALLTRWRVDHVTHIDLSQPGREPRGCIDARIMLNNQSIRVLNTHLGLSRPERTAQLRKIAHHLAGEEIADVCCLLGDINEWLPARVSGRPIMPAHFSSVCAPRTFPSNKPVFRLDRVYLSPAPVGLTRDRRVSVLARTASDHLPVVVDAAWGNKPVGDA